MWYLLAIVAAALCSWLVAILIKGNKNIKGFAAVFPHICIVVILFVVLGAIHKSQKDADRAESNRQIENFKSNLRSRMNNY